MNRIDVWIWMDFSRHGQKCQKVSNKQCHGLQTMCSGNISWYQLAVIATLGSNYIELQSLALALLLRCPCFASSKDASSFMSKKFSNCTSCISSSHSEESSTVTETCKTIQNDPKRRTLSEVDQSRASSKLRHEVTEVTEVTEVRHIRQVRHEEASRHEVTVNRSSSTELKVPMANLAIMKTCHLSGSMRQPGSDSPSMSLSVFRTFQNRKSRPKFSIASVSTWFNVVQRGSTSSWRKRWNPLEPNKFDSKLLILKLKQTKAWTASTSWRKKRGDLQNIDPLWAIQKANIGKSTANHLNLLHACHIYHILPSCLLCLSLKVNKHVHAQRWKTKVSKALGVFSIFSETSTDMHWLPPAISWYLMPAHSIPAILLSAVHVLRGPTWSDIHLASPVEMCFAKIKHRTIFFQFPQLPQLSLQNVLLFLSFSVLLLSLSLSSPCTSLSLDILHFQTKIAKHITIASCIDPKLKARWPSLDLSFTARLS